MIEGDAVDDGGHRHSNDPLVGARLVLEPLRVEHAPEMAVLLDDLSLYEFIGGQPPTLNALRAQYARQAAGRSPDGSQHWLNWVVRVRQTGAVSGYVQATITGSADQECAELAWVIGSQHQGNGYAREAVLLMLGALHSRRVVTVQAHIRPDHHASNAVARFAGLSPTTIIVDGEVRWRTTAARSC